MKILIRIIELSDSISNLDLLINKRILRIIFKIKKYYIICIWNKKSLKFNISEITAKNILIYGVFNKENQEQKTKKYNYRYFNQISENQKNKIQRE